MLRKLLFIINPNAGKKIPELIIDSIRKEFSKSIYYQIVIWKDKDHFDEVTRFLKTEGYTDAVAVGGDGTVNQVARSILGTDIALGIIPVGSGNGLARSLGISVNINHAIKQIEKGDYATIDHGIVNGRPFFCTSGVGFDAHIGNLFATSTTRGLKTYVKITSRELFRYRAKNYTLKINGEEHRRKAFLITVANAGQYGNDFYIAPKADMRDGKFHVSVLKPFSFYHLPGLLGKIMSRKADKSECIETFVADTLEIVREEEGPLHYDGEPAIELSGIAYKCMPSALKVIVGEKFSKS